MTPEELQKREEEEFNTGPLSVLTQSVKNNTQVLINCRNNKKLLGRVKAFDRYLMCLIYDILCIYTPDPNTLFIYTHIITHKSLSRQWVSFNNNCVDYFLFVRTGKFDPNSQHVQTHKDLYLALF